MADTQITHTPIAIVGGGPIGLMLALLLDRHGVRSVLFNTEETTRWHPKGSSQRARAGPARRSSDRRDLFHALRRLGAGAPADAVGGRKAAGDRRRAQDRSG